MVQSQLQLVISSESRLDASSFKRLKTEVGCFSGIVYNQWTGLLDWNTGMDYLIGIFLAGFHTFLGGPINSH